MDFEEKINDCKYDLKQIKHFNPDPYYVDYFFKNYLQSVIDVYDGIFGEADRDFGLFVSGRCTKEKFEAKAREKNDNLALEFLSWFEKHYKDEHDNPYPKFMNKVLEFFAKYEDLPRIAIKMIAKQRYEDDIVQGIHVEMTKGKIRSKESLQIEIKRQIPMFLELINQKRKNNDEPKVSADQVSVSSFLELQDYQDVEIPYACEIYLPVVQRLLEESRKEIKRLTTWTD